MGGLQYADVPGYAGIIFRKTFQDLTLPGALLDRAREWLAGTDAKWNGQDHMWRFPSGGTLAFGYLEHENDKYRYASAEFQYIGYDELTHFQESQYRFLFSRLRRREGLNVPLRMRGASNPGSVGHQWVKQRFLIEGRLAGRPFIPAKLSDNPYLDRESYIASLMELDPLTRLQIMEGDWDAAAEGELFRREWFAIVHDWPRQAKRVRFWDFAATEAKAGTDPDWTAGALVAEQRGQYTICDIQRVRTTPMGVEALVQQTARRDGRDVDIWIEQEPGSSGKSVIDHYQREVLKGYAVRGLRSTGSKVARAQPVSSAAEAGNIALVEGPWITAYLDEASLFPGGAHDDQVDSVSGAIAVLTRGIRLEDLDLAAGLDGLVKSSHWR